MPLSNPNPNHTEDFLDYLPVTNPNSFVSRIFLQKLEYGMSGRQPFSHAYQYFYLSSLR